MKKLIILVLLTFVLISGCEKEELCKEQKDNECYYYMCMAERLNADTQTMIYLEKYKICLLEKALEERDTKTITINAGLTLQNEE